MAQFALPINWEPDFFERIDFTGVTEVYGKLREDFPGGGKSSMAQAQPSRRAFSQAVNEVHARGMKFNYLINTTCIGNRELTRGGYRRLHKLLDWLTEVGVDRITLALPFIAEIVGRRYSHFKVTVSTQADVNSLEKVQYWEDLGVDSITLSHVDMNRNFKELKRITRNSSCKVRLIVNMLCKRRCPFVTLHGNLNAHASHSGMATNRYNMDYYFLSCLARNFSDPLSVVRSNWIRPEDISVYEDLGVHRFKIAERGLTSESLDRIVQAYVRRHYDGNFLDLVPTMSKYVFMKKKNFRTTVRELFRARYVNPFRLRNVLVHWVSLKNSSEYYRNLGLYIDNRDLDGVIQEFISRSCYERTCNGCDYCNDLVRSVVTYPAGIDRHNEDLFHLRSVLDSIVEGDIF